MLLQDQVVEAKEELERALSLQPQDAKSQDLLAGVYFRLGVYPRAIEIWDRLVLAYPRDATLRVNLALALFKTGQAVGALEHVHEALRIHPEHERAWGYLGLIHWRLGNLEEARDAFLRGGQASMARKMEDALRASSAGTVAAPAEGDDEELAAQDRAAMRSAAEEAIERIENEHISIEASSRRGRRPTGTWSPHEPGHEVVPARHGLFRGVPLPTPPHLAEQLDGWLVQAPDDTPLVVGPTGTLFVNAKRDVFLRIRGLAAVRGELRTTSVQRRARGRDLEQVLGGDEPLLHWRGPIDALLEPAEGETFVVVQLSDDTFFVRESVLVGFDERVGFESASLPLANEPVALTQLHGSGLVVLGLRTTPRAIQVLEGHEVRVDGTRLIGWAGRLFPDAGRGTAPYSAAAPRLAFKGTGVVLLG